MILYFKNKKKTSLIKIFFMTNARWIVILYWETMLSNIQLCQCTHYVFSKVESMGLVFLFTFLNFLSFSLVHLSDITREEAFILFVPLVLLYYSSILWLVHHHCKYIQIFSLVDFFMTFFEGSFFFQWIFTNCSYSGNTFFKVHSEK